jgi:dienelactone hydrolase
MNRLALLALLIPSLVWGKATVNSPLYQHLLEQAREHLAAREAKVALISEPEALLARGEEVRAAMIQAMGGFPERSPLNARTEWTKDFGDHKIEGVIFESRPGFPVTANLYLPTQGKPPYPAVLGPCGHETIAKAGEAYQTVWINLARRGFAVLCYDPIGQGERLSFLDKEGKPRFVGTTEHTQLGVQSLLLGYSFAREIVWDGMRALDYLESRPDIDKTRIGCTGNSGGGTQTSYLMALDKRIGCAAPSCYITSLARLFETIGPQDAEQNLPGQVLAGIDQSDYVEACLPRPVLICCAERDFFDIKGTWSTFREAKGFFGRFGMPERVDLIEAPDEHGFTQPRRTAVYHWMARWLMGVRDEAPEPATTPHTEKELLCTETGQVLTSIPGARTLASIYAEEAAGLREGRKKTIASMPRQQWIEEIVKLANIHHPGNLDWAAGAVTHTEGLAQTPLSVEIESGWKLEATLFEPEGGAKGAPMLVLEDAACEGKAKADPAALAHQGSPVLVIHPRGLDDAKRYEGHELDQYFGDWTAAFLAMHIGRPLLGQRTEDVLAAMGLLSTRYPGQKSEVHAVGEAVPPALVAALLDDRISALKLTGGLASWEPIFEAPFSHGVLSNVVPGMLKVADLTDLARAVSPRRVVLEAPCTVTGEPLPDGEVR